MPRKGNNRQKQNRNGNGKKILDRMFGSVAVKTFENERDDGETWNNHTFDRKYFRDEKWETSKSYRDCDLPDLAVAAIVAYFTSAAERAVDSQINKDEDEDDE